MDKKARARRILDVQQKLQKIEEVRMIGLEQQRRELVVARDEVAAALGSDSQLHGLFLDVMARRLGKIAREEALNDQQQQQQRERVLVQGRKAKIAERLAERVEREFDVEERRRLLAEISERYADPPES